MEIPRKAPCPCKSGRKYKRCCLPGEEIRAQHPAQLVLASKSSVPGPTAPSSPQGVLGPVTLKAVLYCVPGWQGIGGSDASEFALQCDVQIPQAKQVPPSEMNGLTTRRSYRRDWHNATFFESSSSSSPDQGLANKRWCESLDRCVQYLFTDGTILIGRELLTHIYINKVPGDLRPIRDRYGRPNPELPKTSLISGRPSRLAPMEIEAEVILQTILLNVRQARKKNTGPELWVTGSQDRDQERPAYRVDQAKCMKDWQGSWELLPASPPEDQLAAAVPNTGRAEARFNVNNRNPNMQVFSTFGIEVQKRELCFHRLEHSIGALHFNTTHTTTQVILGQDAEAADQILTIEARLKNAGLPKLLRKHVISVDAGKTLQVRNEIWISKTGGFHYSRRIEIPGQPQSLFLHHFPSFTAPFFAGLSGGLAGFFNERSVDLACPEDGTGTRQNDLKVLKHTGFFSVMLLEIASYFLHGRLSDGNDDKTNKPSTAQIKSEKIFKEALVNRLGIYLGVDLTNYCSDDVIECIHHLVAVVSQLLTTLSDVYYTPLGQVEIQGTARVQLQFFYALLVNTNGNTLTKARGNVFKDFEIMPTQIELGDDHGDSHVDRTQKYELDPEVLSNAQLSRALLPIGAQGFELYYDGQALEEMGEGDFRPEFNLIEQQNEKGTRDPQLSGNLDWFELHPKFFFKGKEVHPDQISEMARDGMVHHQGKFYLIPQKNIPSIRRLELFWEKIQKGKGKKSSTWKESQYLLLPKSQTLEMLALRASGVQVKGGARWKEICEFYDALDQKRPPFRAPKQLQGDLKEYQKTGVQWLLDLYHLGLGGILADDMGLGKTFQTLAFLESLRERNELGNVLIVVPTSLTYNWMQEGEKFAPKLPIQVFHPKTWDAQKSDSSPTPSVLICTYGLLLQNSEKFKNIRWNIVIYDEAQNLKNITAQRTTVCRKIAARFKLCLTGTPLENHLGEFYSLMDLVVPGCLGDYMDYCATFVTPDTLDRGQIQYLKLKIKPLVLRRAKSEILKDLPPKIENIIKLGFEKKQEKIYRDIALSWNEKVKQAILANGVAKNQIVMLTALLRLRQTCSDPNSIPQVNYPQVPPKFELLLETLTEILEAGESVLVFTQFLDTFHRLEKELSKAKMPHFGIHGGVSRVKREEILSLFKASEKGSVMLMTLKTGGVGLNLTKATYVFHLEPWWNPAVENQATDRAHRMGQDQTVKVFRYIMKESVEEKIQLLKERKSERFQALFSDEDETLDDALAPSSKKAKNSLSQADFEYLLS